MIPSEERKDTTSVYCSHRVYTEDQVQVKYPRRPTCGCRVNPGGKGGSEDRPGPYADVEDDGAFHLQPPSRHDSGVFFSDDRHDSGESF